MKPPVITLGILLEHCVTKLGSVDKAVNWLGTLNKKVSMRPATLIDIGNLEEVWDLVDKENVTH